MKIDQNIKTFNIKSGNYKEARPIYPLELFELFNQLSYSKIRAWDCACGSGQVAVTLDLYFKEVYATDLNENQVMNSYGSDSIHYSVQNSEDTIFPDNYFDLICVAQAMHWFDLDKYFKEVKRLLKTGGLFTCFGYSFFKISPEIDNIIKENFLDPIKPYWSEKNRIIWNGYKDVEFPFKKIKTPKIEMKVNWNLNQLIDYMKTWSAYKRYDESNIIDISMDLKSSLINIWPMEEIKEINMDFCLYVGQNNSGFKGDV